jgi:hypothetical protein
MASTYYFRFKYFSLFTLENRIIYNLNRGVLLLQLRLRKPAGAGQDDSSNSPRGPNSLVPVGEFAILSLSVVDFSILPPDL